MLVVLSNACHVQRSLMHVQHSLTTFNVLVAFSRCMPYTALPHDIQDMLVEMDIINTPDVQLVRSLGVLPDGERAKRSATKKSALKWPGNNIPYKFHVSVSKFTADAVKFKPFNLPAL